MGRSKRARRRRGKSIDSAYITDDVPEQLADRGFWGGLSYSLNIVIGPYDDAVLKTATRTLLTAADIEDLWRGVPYNPRRIEGDAWTLEDLTDGSLYSLVELPSGQQVNCEVWAFRYLGTLNDPPLDDWLYLDIPAIALARLDPRIGALPDGDRSENDPETRAWRLDCGHEPGSLAWRRPIDDWLAQAAIEVSRAVSFKRALIGHNVTGFLDGWLNSKKGRPWGLVLPDGTYLPTTY